jgi:hypothetical protein
MGQTMQHPQMMGQPQMMGHGGMGGPGGPSMQGHHMPGPPPPVHPGNPNPGGQELPKIDNISKAKALMPTLKESVAVS